jgi:hypothetical protein
VSELGPAILGEKDTYSKDDWDVWAKLGEGKHVGDLSIVQGWVADVVAAAILPLVSGLLLPLPEDSINVLEMRM